MINKLNHVSIAVSNLEASVKIFEEIFGKKVDEITEVPEQKVKAAMFELSGVLFEIIQSTDTDSAVAQFVDNRGNALHHIAFSVDNIDVAIAEYQEKGFRMIDKTPRIGAEGKPIAFMHPKSSDGILVEIVEDNNGGK